MKLKLNNGKVSFLISKMIIIQDLRSLELKRASHFTSCFCYCGRNGKFYPRRCENKFCIFYGCGV